MRVCVCVRVCKGEREWQSRQTEQLNNFQTSQKVVDFDFAIKLERENEKENLMEKRLKGETLQKID